MCTSSFLAIVICITVSLVKSRNQRREMLSYPRRRDNQQFVHMTLVLILICTVFFITVSPIAIHKTLKNLLDTRERLDPLRFVRMSILWHMFKNMSFANHGLNFVLYMITMSTFREELKALLFRRSVNDSRSNDTGTRQSTL